MIILEGPDGGGKSTLSGELSDAFSRMPVHSIGRSPGTSEGVRANIRLCQSRVRDRCVQDRVTQISEQIYGAVFGRQHIPEAAFHTAQLLLAELNPIIVYCRVEDLDKVVHTQEEYETEDDIRRVTENLLRLRSLYDDLFSRPPFAELVIRFDYTTDNIQELIDEFIRPRIS